MGGVNSYCVPRYQNPNRCRENHTSTPKIKGHKRNLSAAFNLADMESDLAPLEQLNINTATEEELMTLPGINRVTAHNIVDYRRQIGGFKKVEDLALVSGVGATKLGQIRLEICVRPKKGSEGSSRSSSARDLSVQDNVSKSSARSGVRGIMSYPKVNINTSNVFQLMKVKGISQQVAENIVAYRDRKGQFKNVDDLVKVKGIGLGVVSAIRPYLVLIDDDLHEQFANGVALNSSHPPLQTKISNESSTSHHHIANMTAPPVFGDSQDDLLAMYGPLLRKSFRRNMHPPSLRRGQRRVLRITSWNLQNFTSQKVDNPGVREVVALTILENGLSIVAVQEIADENALSTLCDELNSPTVPKVKKWPGQRGSWRAVVSSAADSLPQGPEHLGFLYDTSQGVELVHAILLDGYPELPGPYPNKLCPKPFMAHFKVKDWEFKVFSVHLPSSSSCGEVAPSGGQLELREKIHNLALAVQEHSLEGGSTIILGDLGSLSKGEVSELFEGQGHGYKVALPGDKLESGKGENIWMGGQVLAQYTGFSQVVEEGLRSPWIPDGWQWGGRVSEHCPVWAEFYTEHTKTNSVLGAMSWNGAGDS